MPRGKAIRNKNGYGTVVKLSGNRRQPYEVRVNTRMDVKPFITTSMNYPERPFQRAPWTAHAPHTIT